MLFIFLKAFLVIMTLMTILWIVSILIKNVSIVDPFWGFGFVIVNLYYFFDSGESNTTKIILLLLVTIWGSRLTVYLAIRNIGKGEDFRYQEFRKNFGEHRYWWFSFFQTFLLQGVLMWIISLPLLGVNINSDSGITPILFYSGLIIWIIGFVFETGGDYQLSKFKKNKGNKGKVLSSGFWKYTRHPNYFGDSAIWWGFGMISLSVGGYWYIIGSIVMTLLIIKVSGVALLEKTLKSQKPEYKEYIKNTSAFLPWFPKKSTL